jgi:hypothetical protein
VGMRLAKKPSNGLFLISSVLAVRVDVVLSKVRSICGALPMPITVKGLPIRLCFFV